MNINQHIRQEFGIHEIEYPPFIGNKDRNYFGKLFCDLGYKVGAEIGVRTGGYSEVLLKQNPELKMYCIDPWCESSGIEHHKMKRLYATAVETLSRYNVEIMRTTSMEAVKSFNDDSLDFVYIDALHDFDHVMLDIIHWSTKVRPGGIVSGHDYIVHPAVSVIPAVNAYTAVHGINQWYVTWEKLNSWFWVK
jgi:predicted O-methyltransferase YrrM